jgi:hypothetical protein
MIRPRIVIRCRPHRNGFDVKNAFLRKNQGVGLQERQFLTNRALLQTVARPHPDSGGIF